MSVIILLPYISAIPMTEAEGKDLILKYLVDNLDRRFSAEYFIEESVLPEGTQLGSVEHLIETIENYPIEIAYVNIQAHGHFIGSNNKTELFLNQGGFTEVEKRRVEEQHIQKEQDNIAHEKSKIDLELAKKMLKEYPKTKWFARIGFIIGTGLALLKLAEYLGFLQPPN